MVSASLWCRLSNEKSPGKCFVKFQRSGDPPRFSVNVMLDYLLLFYSSMRLSLVFTVYLFTTASLVFLSSLISSLYLIPSAALSLVITKTFSPDATKGVFLSSCRAEVYIHAKAQREEGKSTPGNFCLYTSKYGALSHDFSRAVSVLFRSISIRVFLLWLLLFCRKE